jgi:hypothetical protein
MDCRINVVRRRCSWRKTVSIQLAKPQSGIECQFFDDTAGVKTKKAAPAGSSRKSSKSSKSRGFVVKSALLLLFEIHVAGSPGRSDDGVVSAYWSNPPANAVVVEASVVRIKSFVVAVFLLNANTRRYVMSSFPGEPSLSSIFPGSIFGSGGRWALAGRSYHCKRAEGAPWAVLITWMCCVCGRFSSAFPAFSITRRSPGIWKGSGCGGE